ncbi:MAG: DUF2935 domain-containing protein [Clostridiales bacterium]|nr:DUF2935 domain-containing protein [Clostridiales bacterium]
MTQNYITLSLETHLFFARIMKEHALFLESGFPCQERVWTERAAYFRLQFEELLSDVAAISSGRVNDPILDSGELATEFTLTAEKQTEALSGIPINTDITRMEQHILSEPFSDNNRHILRTIHRINRRSLQLLNGLIRFKSSILREVSAGRLFTANYPLLIQHIIREAQLYRSTISQLLRYQNVSCKMILGTETFWNQIMMEHAFFIRGLLDPSEEELIKTAHGFAKDYKRLLDKARESEDTAVRSLTNDSLEETLKYRDFKTAGTKGILKGEISSIILPLLADHVLREANHYIRILEYGRIKED